MPRANRYFLPGYVWHITQRCHKRSFLLKFLRDRNCWFSWLHESKKRYGLCILNYTVTSNHIHLLVFDQGKGEIEASMQLIAGRTAQAYNRRKSRRGAFWEDRYHATAVDSDAYLARCMTYIDLNMVRAGVVERPEQWSVCGYREIQHPSRRYRCIDTERLSELMGLPHSGELALLLAERVDGALSSARPERESIWTESLAVGSESFVSSVGDALGIRARYRKVQLVDEVFTIGETAAEYSADFEGEMGILR